MISIINFKTFAQSVSRSEVSEMGKPILYQLQLSPPVRSVIFFAKAINLELELKELDLFNHEHLKPEFLALNPHHTVPTLDDNGHVVWDSHAIMIYLMEKYAKNDSLYPKDVAKRSTVNQRLFFDAAVVFPSLRNAVLPVFLDGQPEINERQRKAINNAYELLNAVFKDNKFVVGNTITVADYSLITNITQLEAVLPINDSEYPKIRPWIKKVSEIIPDFENQNSKVVEEYRTIVAKMLKDNAAKAKA